MGGCKMRKNTQRYAFSVSVMGTVTKIQTVLNKNDLSGQFWKAEVFLQLNFCRIEPVILEKLFGIGKLLSCMFGFVLCIIMVLYKNDDSSFFHDPMG